MTEQEAEALATEAAALGYQTEVRELWGGSYRLYLTRADGRWTFCTDEDDLHDVHASRFLWCAPWDRPAFLAMVAEDEKVMGDEAQQGKAERVGG